MSAQSDRRFARDVRALVAEVGLHDPVSRGELAQIFDGSGRSRKYLRRTGVNVDGLGELLWSRGLTPARLDPNGVLTLLGTVFDGTVAPKRRKRRVAKRAALIGIEADAIRAKNNRLHRYVCPSCGAIAYASAVVTPEHCGGVPMQRTTKTFNEVMTQTAHVESVPF